MLILGSKSPRRKEILEMSEIPFKAVYKDISEDIQSISPCEYVLLTSKKKALAILEDYPNDLILGCDTIVYLNDEILEKPTTKEEAYQMIEKIQGKTHYVFTGVYLVSQEMCESFYEKTEVEVSQMTEDEIKAYINTEEPYDKAGGYAIQGIFCKYIKKINGDYYNVVGLPINRIYDCLKRRGL